MRGEMSVIFSISKKSIYNIKQLRELYINNGMDSYIPSSILKNGLLFL